MKAMKSLKAAPPQTPFLSSAFLHALHSPWFFAISFRGGSPRRRRHRFLSVFLSGLTSAMSKANTLNQEPRTTNQERFYLSMSNEHAMM